MSWLVELLMYEIQREGRGDCCRRSQSDVVTSLLVARDDCCLAPFRNTVTEIERKHAIAM